MGFSHAQILGFAKDVQKVLDEERAALKRMGVDGKELTGQIQRLHEQTVAVNARQEDMKRELKATTVTYMATRRKLYVIASGALDTAMAAVEKNSDAAKNLRRLRSRVRAPRGPDVPVAGPLPTPS